MTALAVPLVLLSLLAQTPAPKSAPRELVARAVTAMGGESAVRGIRNYTITFYSVTFGLGQEVRTERRVSSAPGDLHARGLCLVLLEAHARSVRVV